MDRAGAGKLRPQYRQGPEAADIQPWAEALYQQRVRDMGKDAPRANCLPDPFVYYHMVDVARMVQTPQVIVMLYQGTTNSVHRTIFTDGRPLPADPNPTWMGYSTGHWEGDTLAVDTAGFNDRGWLDIEGHPHTEALRITERYHRRDFGHLDLEVTIDDPKTFTRPFSLKIQKTLKPDTDLLESVCENDTSVPHMLGGKAVKLSPEILASYAGAYEYGPGRAAAISFAGDLLYLQEGGSTLKLPLVASSETVFLSRTEGNWIEFLRDSSGAVSGSHVIIPATPHERRSGGNQTAWAPGCLGSAIRRSRMWRRAYRGYTDRAYNGCRHSREKFAMRIRGLL